MIAFVDDGAERSGENRLTEQFEKMLDWKFAVVAGRGSMRLYDRAGRLKADFVMDMDTRRRKQHGESHVGEQRKHAELSKFGLHTGP
ncbi:MAG: hypothetical protein RLN70_06530 [Rhodospirillaceae bacterium]